MWIRIHITLKGRIQIRIKLKGRIQIRKGRIRIRSKVIRWIQIRIRIEVISWIRIGIYLQMTSQNVWNMSLFENFFKVLSFRSASKWQAGSGCGSALRWCGSATLVLNKDFIRTAFAAICLLKVSAVNVTFWVIAVDRIIRDFQNIKLKGRFIWRIWQLPYVKKNKRQIFQCLWSTSKPAFPHQSPQHRLASDFYKCKKEPE